VQLNIKVCYVCYYICSSAFQDVLCVDYIAFESQQQLHSLPLTAWCFTSAAVVFPPSQICAESGKSPFWTTSHDQLGSELSIKIGKWILPSVLEFAREILQKYQGNSPGISHPECMFLKLGGNPGSIALWRVSTNPRLGCPQKTVLSGQMSKVNPGVI